MSKNRDGNQTSTALKLDGSGVLSWIHFGDLHMTEAREQNHHDFLALIEHANTHLAGDIRFAVLPGDNTDDGY